MIAVAEYDPLRDEGRAYAEALQAASVPVVLHDRAGLVHGCYDMLAFPRPSLRARPRASQSRNVRAQPTRPALLVLVATHDQQVADVIARMRSGRVGTSS